MEKEVFDILTVVLWQFDTASVRFARKLVQEWHDPAATADNVTSAGVSVKHVKEPKDSDKKILKTRIARKDLIDSSGNRVCCPICLQVRFILLLPSLILFLPADLNAHRLKTSFLCQDFEFREVAQKLPCCHHLFHKPCIDKWLRRHDSCPLCRCIVVCRKLNRV